MSAFMVSEDTLHRIVNFLKHDRETSADYIVRELGFKLNTEDDCSRFGQALWNMNRNAVNQRYAPVYQFKHKHCGIMQAYKSIGCLRYQCSEGDVPAMPLYRALTDVHHVLANRIVSDLPEYDKATYD